MVFNELKEDISQLIDGSEDYVESTKEYFKLSVFKVFMKSISSLVKLACVGYIIFLALVILSFAASFGIGQALNNIFYGFLCVGLFYILVGIIFYILRKGIDKSLLRRFSEYYFEEL